MNVTTRRWGLLREWLLAFVGFSVAFWLLLYPVFARPGERVFAPASALVAPIAKWVMWILAWDTQALSLDPTRWIDANVFHPVPGALGFGDALLGSVPLFAPVYLVSGNPVLAYQCMLLATMSMCGAGMFVLVRHWGCSAAASLLAGVVYALAPPRLGVLGEYPYLAGQFLPLALLFADRLVVQGNAAALFGLIVFSVWQALCGAQLGYGALVVLAVYLVGLAVFADGQRSWPGWLAALFASGLACAALAVSIVPYRNLQETGLFVGPSMYDFAVIGSAHPWRSYLIPPYLPSLGWTGPGGGLYLGAATVALAVFGATVGVRRRLVARLLLLAVATYWMSLGPAALGSSIAPYAVALARIPGFDYLGPAPVRFALWFLIPLAGLAALGADALAGFLTRKFSINRTVAAFVVLVLCALVVVDYRPPSRTFRTQHVMQADEQPLYASLAQLPDGPVLELPMDPCSVDEATPVIDRQLASTAHWKPLLDGYRSHDRAPVTFDLVRAAANALPDRRALEFLRRSTDLRYVVVHLGALSGTWRHRWREVDGLTRVGFFGQDLLFEVAGPSAGSRLDLFAPEVLQAPSRTLGGAPAARLAPQPGWVRWAYTDLPPGFSKVGGRLRAELLIENRSTVIWPATVIDDRLRVYVSYLWAGEDGALISGDGRAQALPFDLQPGASVVVPVCVETPHRSGDFRLVFGLAQAEKWFPDVAEGLALTILP